VPWVPRERPNFRVDFEDWYDLENGFDEGVWLAIIPEPLENGEDLSPLWFILMSAQAAENDKKSQEDFWLRKAAQRGSWYAMKELAALRYELGHLEESMRWNQRLISWLNDFASAPDHLITPLERDDFREILDDAIANVAYLASQGVSASTNNPKDLYAKSSFAEQLSVKDEWQKYKSEQTTYCLKCGKWKIGSAPLSQCDDSVHLTPFNFG